MRALMTRLEEITGDDGAPRRGGRVAARAGTRG
jgi:hypothetical protein